jgi:3-hydroxyisobutyrate dehydrogenase
MAGHLAQAGHQVTVFNRTAAKAQAWVAEHGGAAGASPAAAAAGAEIVFTCVGNDDDVRSVVLGDQGALAGMSKGAILVDHTTASAELARELDRAAKGRGMGFLDAPVSGGQAGAESGKLTVMVGGDPANFARAEKIIGHYGRAVTLMGPAGNGQLTKMVNQILIAGLVQGLAEGLNFAVRAGLDPRQAAEVIAKGAAQSWQLENRYQTMLDGKFDFGFAVDWMRKDLAICLAEARRNKSALPVTALVDQFYERVQERGGARWDTSSLIHLLTKP